MEAPSDPPEVFHFRNRTLILIATPPIAVLCIAEISSNLTSGEPWLNWLAGLVLWLFIFLVALRRRLAVSAQAIEYTEFFHTARIPWPQTTRIATRKTLGIWTVEGIEGLTQSPTPKDVFIELTQFSRSWRKSCLGTALRAKAPHLFRKSTFTTSAA